MSTPEEGKLDVYPKEEEEENEEHDNKEKEQDDENLKEKEIENSEIHLFGHDLKKQYGTKIIIYILIVFIILLCLSLFVLFLKYFNYFNFFKKEEEIPKFVQSQNITLDNTSLPIGSTYNTSIINIIHFPIVINDKDVKSITQIPIAINGTDTKYITQLPIIINEKDVKNVTQITFATNETSSKHITQFPVIINEIDSKNITQPPFAINGTDLKNITQLPIIINGTDLKNVTIAPFGKNETNSKNITHEKGRINENVKKTINASNVLNNTLVKRNETNKKYITVGFLYRKLTIFMISTGEFFIKTGKYKIYFLTELPRKNELKYNPKIKRTNAYFNMKSIKTVCKKEKIDFLIVSDGLSKEHIKSLKTLNIKLIGITEDEYLSYYFVKKKSLYSNKLGLYDVYIQKSIEDYNKYRKLNLTNNIIIQNTFTLLSGKKQASNKTNHNIVMLADLDDKKINITSLISSMSLIVKVNSTTKLNIFSTSKPSKELTELIKKLQLGKYIVFNVLNDKIFNYFRNCSIFIYASSSEVYQNLLNEAKVYGLPCIILYNFKRNIAFNKGVIKLDLSNKERYVREIVRIMNDNNYKKKIRNETKLSLNIENKNIEKIWEKLFNSLKSGKKRFNN